MEYGVLIPLCLADTLSYASVLGIDRYYAKLIIKMIGMLSFARREALICSE